MPVTIQKMTKEEFERFLQWSIEDHAKELMEEFQISHERALKDAQAEVSQMLPDGIHTKNNDLMTITASGKNVGFIWTLYEETNGQKQCFLCDFAIWEPNRRNGYGEAALRLIEEKAAALGSQESVLFVRDGNDAANALYHKCGYRLLRQEGCGKYMIKQLN